jgi:hypothetical protein
MRSVVLALSLSVASGGAFAQGTPPPPTTPDLARRIGDLGTMDRATNREKSFDSGQQWVGTQFFPSWWYRFNMTAPPSGSLLFSVVCTGPSYGATITVLDNRQNVVGQVSGTNPPNLRNGDYYLHVTAPSHTKFRFGVIAPPPLSQYPNDAGRTSEIALDLGRLNKVIVHANNFYTFFNRQTIDCGSSSSEERPLEPDFNDPNPNPPVQMDFYRFTLPKAGPVKLFNAGSWIGSHGPTYIIQPSNSNPAVWSDKQTLDLEGGTYLLKVLDQLTQASGGASNPIFRDPHAENIEPYQFELLYEP